MDKTEMVVGIPQALLYHEFGELWTSFFHYAGVKSVVSETTNKKILDNGSSLAVNESCLPLKVFLGHVESLLAKCTHIFVPRISQYHRNCYCCGKLAGLPDIVGNTFDISPEKLIVPNIEGKTKSRQLENIYATCRSIGVPFWTGYRAFEQALSTWSQRCEKPLLPQDETTKVAIVGHSYIINDDYLCQPIMHTLQLQGVSVITADVLSPKALYREASIYAKDIYWQLSAKIAGAVHYFCTQADISGVIVVSSFGCGPDSLVNEYLEHYFLQKNGMPYMILNIDEHTGNAGIVTRVEAFLDLIKRRGCH